MATDRDEGINRQIEYSITGGDNSDHFNIDKDHGFIVTARKIDYESQKHYLLTIKGSAFRFKFLINSSLSIIVAAERHSSIILCAVGMKLMIDPLPSQSFIAERHSSIILCSD